MEGFCILWAGKLVIGSAVSSCAKCRQETKMWTLVIGSSLSGQDQLILAARRNGIVTIRDDIWERGGIKQNCYQSLSLHPQFSFTQIAINSSGNSGTTSESCTESHLSIGVWKLGRKSIGSTTIKAHRWKSKPADEMNEKLRKHDNQTIRWNERKWPEENWGSQASLNLPRLSQCFSQAIIEGKWNDNFVWERSYILLYHQSWEL